MTCDDRLLRVAQRHAGNLEGFPVCSAKSADKRLVQRVVRSVDQMILLHEKLAAAKAAHDKTSLERQIAATDRQIDRLVYELYRLTPDEITIVEEATGTTKASHGDEP